VKPAFLIGLVLGVLFLAIAVFYMIPGPTKPFVSDAPTDAHIKHALVAVILGLAFAIGGRFVANSSPTK
jgi:hypothetical protein